VNALVLAAGDLPLPGLLPGLLAGVELVVAADAGLAHAARLGLDPQLIIGDLDSVDPALLSRYHGVPLSKHSVDKDELDLELALAAARRLGASSIRVLGAFGGRLDHSLAALFVGARWVDEGVALSLHGGSHEAWFCTPARPLRLTLARSTTVSLFALRGAAVLSSSGLRYALDHTPLDFGTGLGVSNVADDGSFSIDASSGSVAVVVEHGVAVG